MTVYTLADREWTTGPNGVSISVIPGRELVYTLAEPGPACQEQHFNAHGTTIRHITEHGCATVEQMVPDDEHITPAALYSCLRYHPKRFERCPESSSQMTHVWRLVVQP